MHIVFFSQNGLLRDHPVLIGMAVNGEYSRTFSQDEVRPALQHEEPELLERGFTLLEDNATPHHNHDVQNLVHRWGLGGVGTSSILSRSCPIWLLVAATCERTSSG
jgi:hypothetical protein